MSREVRRVPLDYKHPTEFNTYWRGMQKIREMYGDPDPALHPTTERFVSLSRSYPDALVRWQERFDEISQRQGHEWEFQVGYYLSGYQGHYDETPLVHDFYPVDGSPSFKVRDEDHLAELLHGDMMHEKPRQEEYMPEWSDEEKSGWCLYETITEGTPVTPVFATAEELIEHLVTVGQDGICAEQGMLRREAAEALVRSGGSVGSFIIADGQVFNSTQDADKIQDIL